MHLPIGGLDEVRERASAAAAREVLVRGAAREPRARQRLADHPEWVDGLVFVSFRITSEVGPEPFAAYRAAYERAYGVERVGVGDLVQHGDETAGVIVVRDAGEGVAQVELDYVTPRYRDFTPGEFVFRRSGLFRDRGFSHVLSPPGMVAPYYDRVGFIRQGDRYRLDLV